VLVPVKSRPRELDIDTKTRNALLRSLRYQGERGFALMSQRWRAMQHVSVSPTTIGDIAKVRAVLVQFEHKMIS
jgi:hypothetical protein